MTWTLGISKPHRCAIARTSRIKFSVNRWLPVRTTLNSTGALGFFRFTGGAGDAMAISNRSLLRSARPRLRLVFDTLHCHARQRSSKLIQERSDSSVPRLHIIWLQWSRKCKDHDLTIVIMILRPDTSTTHGSILQLVFAMPAVRATRYVIQVAYTPSKYRISVGTASGHIAPPAPSRRSVAE